MPAEIPLTRIQASLLANLLNQIRPEWQINSMMTLFFENQTFAPFPALVEAAVKVARNPAKKFPNVIFMTGSHWDTTTPNIGAQAPAGPPCEDHDTEPAHNCRSCIADTKVGQRPITHIGKHYTPESETTA
ncbi:hypothetical protein ACIQXM_01895 [Arthrobacter sp. NPDC097144]|uniref:hypothetical protein n=1 Tax=Arthrobacter sp. NPDC097144 TaxID=3363946 RepID=UPI0038011937